MSAAALPGTGPTLEKYTSKMQSGPGPTLDHQPPPPSPSPRPPKRMFHLLTVTGTGGIPKRSSRMTPEAFMRAMSTTLLDEASASGFSAASGAAEASPSASCAPSLPAPWPSPSAALGVQKTENVCVCVCV